MAKLVLLVVAAAWAAVLIPPMLRSRVENRPNSSVTDFRRQLRTLQSTANPTRATRAFGRPLTQSPLQRPAAAGRPGHAHHRQASLNHSATAQRTRHGHRRGDVRTSTAYRTHGDPSGGIERPQRHAHSTTRMDRQPIARAVEPRADVKRRRGNVLFLLVATTACALFLAATTSSTILLYVFALSFLALCGYVYLLAQLRQREDTGWSDGWLEPR